LLVAVVVLGALVGLGMGVIAVGPAQGSPTVVADEQEDPAPCCFRNQGYGGVCLVTPAKGETCASILDYLNNPQSQGKSYCTNTAVRGGWTAVDCKTGQGSSASSLGR
jgi:hypothetical protein